MANKDWPRGFQFGYTKHGGPPQLTRYYTDGAAAIYIGDLVDMTNGRIASVTATTDLPVGVAASYTGSTDETTEVFVYDDLQNTVFIAQADTTQIAGTSLVNTGKDLLATAGTTDSEISNMEIDVSASCVGYIWILDKVNRVDNDWGGNVDLYCEILSDPKARARTHPSS